MSRVSCMGLAGVGLLMMVLSGCQESSMKREKGEAMAGVCMGFEHIGLNVRDPQASADWYCKNLGMTVVRTPSANAFFLADAGRRMMLELYHNPQAPVPDYESIQLLSLHISFVVDHLEVFRTRLIAAGARPAGGGHDRRRTGIRWPTSAIRGVYRSSLSSVQSRCWGPQRPGQPHLRPAKGRLSVGLRVDKRQPGLLY